MALINILDSPAYFNVSDYYEDKTKNGILNRK